MGERILAKVRHRKFWEAMRSPQANFRCDAIGILQFKRFLKGEEKMIKAESKKLLQDERVLNEINQHKWFESEKVGYDIGFEKAAEDWINRYSQTWLKKNDGNRTRR